MNFSATEPEFRYRFWLIGVVFFVAFFCYTIDHVNFSVAVAQLALGLKPGQESASLDRYARLLLALGAVIAAAAALLRTWAEAYLHSSIVHDAKVHSDQLVADGPYRHVRNPLYLGNVLLAVGVGFMASRTGFFVLVVGMFLVSMRLALREEAGLLQSQGESYKRYFDKVPRFLPSLRARVPASGKQPNWLDGFSGELFIWGFPAGVAAFAATERILYFWGAFGLGFAIYFLQDAVRKKPAVPGAQ